MSQELRAAWFQSAPSRGRRRSKRTPESRAQRVSIRAFARKATASSLVTLSASFLVSIRAFARKATREGPDEGGGHMFQSAPSRGRRPQRPQAGSRSRPRFNPRLREEGDITSPIIRLHLFAFQSAPSRGRRPPTPSWDAMSYEFQSAPSRGRRQIDAGRTTWGHVVSIRAFARKATGT